MLTEDIFQASPLTFSSSNTILNLFQLIQSFILFAANKLPIALRPSFLVNNQQNANIMTSSILTNGNNAIPNNNNNPKAITFSKSIIWFIGKLLQIWAVFHLYYLVIPHKVLRTTKPRSPRPFITIDTLTKSAIAVAGATFDQDALEEVIEKPYMSLSVASLYVLVGAVLGWILIEHAVRFLFKRYPNLTSPTPYNMEQTEKEIDKLSNTNMLSNGIITKLVLHSMWITGSVLLWICALTTLGPSRVILLQFVEHCLVIFIGHILGWKSSPRAMQSKNFLLLIISFTLIILSRVDEEEALTWTERIFLTGKAISFSEFFSRAWYLLIFILSLIFTVLRKNHAKKLSVDLKKVNFEQNTTLTGSNFWITIVVATVLLFPFILFNFILNPGETLLEIFFVFQVLKVIIYGICLITIPFYTEQMSQIPTTVIGADSNMQMSDQTPSIVPPLIWRAIITFALVILLFSWQTTVIIVGFLLLLKTISEITNSPLDKSTPLPSFALGAGASLFSSSNSKQNSLQSGRLLNKISHGATMYLQFILSNRDSKYLFIFLLANLIFMFVELAYGIWSNSLGLISDSAHMLFDCAALGIGLYGAFMSKWKRNQTYTYGYSRYEFLSGFVNGLLLLFISGYIFIEGFHRVFDPPTIDTHRLLLISILGFLVNLMGVIFFHNHHHHGSNNINGHQHDENMHGVYLHILADTLGSVGVIISTLLMQYYGWFLSDPLCSIMISILILTTSYPLIINSFTVLLQRSPIHLDKDISDCIRGVECLDGVLQVYNVHFWTLSSSVIVGSLHLKVRDNINAQNILKLVSDMFRNQCNICDLTVQIEKSENEATSSSASPSHIEQIPLLPTASTLTDIV